MMMISHLNEDEDGDFASIDQRTDKNELEGMLVLCKPNKKHY